MSGEPPDNEIQYDPHTETYSTTFVGPPSEAILAFIDSIWGQPVEDSEPLYHSIDIEALDQLLLHREGPTRQGDLSVTFPYRGYEITIQSFGVLRAEPKHGNRTNCE